MKNKLKIQFKAEKTKLV